MSKFIAIKHRGSNQTTRETLKKNTKVKIQNGDAVDIVAKPSEVAAMEQHGSDLVIRFTDGSITTLEGYFNCSPGAEPALSVLDPATGQLMSVSYQNGVCGASPATMQQLAYTLTPSGEGDASAFLPAAGGLGLGPLLGLGAAAGGAAAAAGGGGGNTAGGGNPPADTTAPTPPVIAPTNGRTISGTAEAGSTVTLDLGGNGSTDATATADASGNWSVTPAAPVPDRTTITVKATDPAGNVSQPTTVTVDASTPTPTIGAVNDDVGAVIGAVANGGTTDDARPQISGSGAEAGATITVRDDTAVLGTATADPAGNWTFTPGTALADGTHTLTAQATDTLGNVSGASAGYVITVNTDGPGPAPATPSTPSIGAVTDDVGTITGAVANGGVTDDARPTVAGSGAPANGAVTVSDGATVLGTTTADAAGNWSFTPMTALADGAHSITARAADASGTSSAASQPVAITIDTAAPAAPVVNPSDGMQVSGTTEPGSSVLIDINGDGSVEATVATDGSGGWTYTPTTPLSHGTTVTVRAADPAGNTSPPATAIVDAAVPVPPAAPTIDTVTDDVGTIVGLVSNGAPTNDILPAVAGSGAAAGASISVFDGAVLLGTTMADASGDWTFTPQTPLGEGTHNFTATATTADGTSAASAAFAITIDTTPPAAPVIDPTDGNAVTGTAEPGASVALDTDGNGSIDANVPVNGTGNWTYTPAAPFADGAIISAAAVDAAGNASGLASVTVHTGVDTTPPGAPTIDSVLDDVGAETGAVTGGGSTDDTRPAISGSGAEAGSTVTLFDGATTLGTTTADVSGNWSFTPAAPLALGAHSFTATSTDAAGNAGAASAAYAITIAADTTPPAAPVIGAVIDDIGIVTGTVIDGGVTDDTLPVITGSGAEAGATVTVRDGATVIGTAIANGSGSWSVAAATALGGGAHSFTATVTDAAGNTGPASAAYGIVIDTTAPTSTIDITSLTLDTGTPGDWITADASPVIGGTLTTALAIGERVDIRLDGSAAWTAATVSGTSWFYGPGTLTAGNHNVEVRVIDNAGNVGSTDLQAITISGANQAPIAQAQSSALLGLVSADALDLVEIDQQSLTAFDPDGNLANVVVRYEPLVNLGDFSLTASTALATELGLQFNVANVDGILGLLAPSSTMTITAIGGGAVSNQAVNELLATVHFEQGSLLSGGLGTQVLDATSITATDALGASGSSSAAGLLNLSLLDSAAPSNVIEGTSGPNLLNGTSLNERIYGYDGADTLNGGDGSDLLRGSGGIDILHGDNGDDVLVYDAADAVIDGGAGIDILLIDQGTGNVLTLDAAMTKIQSIERIHLGTADGGRAITVTEAGITNATSAGTLVVTGDGQDSVTLIGALHTGQVLISGEAYNQYALGGTTALIQSSMTVFA